MDDDLTHTIKIEVTGHYPHGVKEHAIVSLSGSGDADHYLDAIRAAMFAGGFVIDTVGRVRLSGRADE